MYTSNGGAVLGAAGIGGTGLALLGFPVETSVIMGIVILAVLLGCYLFYKFRNRHLR